jgi:hypothetical protein
VDGHRHADQAEIAHDFGRERAGADDGDACVVGGRDAHGISSTITQTE